MEPTGHLGLQSHSRQTKWFGQLLMHSKNAPKNCLHMLNGMVVKMFSGHRLGGYLHEENGRVFEFASALGSWFGMDISTQPL